MGVMACSRSGCDEIMCHRCILEHTAYICSDCFSELLKLKDEWPDKMSAAEVRKRIEEFMETEKDACNILDEKGIHQEFKRLMDY